MEAAFMLVQATLYACYPLCYLPDGLLELTESSTGTIPDNTSDRINLYL